MHLGHSDFNSLIPKTSSSTALFKNKNFSTSYNYGNFREQNNNIQKVPQGEVVVYNLFKTYDTYKSIVMFTDGLENSSGVNSTQIGEILRNGKIPVYSIAIQPYGQVNEFHWWLQNSRLSSNTGDSYNYISNTW